MSEKPQRERKLHSPFLLKLHKEAGAATKAEHERREAPVFRRKPKPTNRQSSIEFWNKWN